MESAHISERAIKRATGEYDLEVVRKLSLVGQGMRGLERCCNLVNLCLRANQISEIVGLAELNALELLDLSSNRISIIPHMDTLLRLRCLHLEDNLIGIIDDVIHLQTFPALASLHFREFNGSRPNPMCLHPAYSSIVRGHLPGLQTLDGQRLELVELGSDLALEMQASAHAIRDLPRERWFQDSDLDDSGLWSGESAGAATEAEDALAEDVRQCHTRVHLHAQAERREHL